MVFADPDFPRVVWSFGYRGWQLEIDQTELDGYTVYSVWANHATGCAVAVPAAPTQKAAIQQAKHYVDLRLSHDVVKNTDSGSVENP